MSFLTNLNDKKLLMAELNINTRSRVYSIDTLRGLVMVIMALDHVRDFFFRAAVTAGGASVATNPTNMATTTPALFFTRWITHFCAPLFVFLAGTSIFLMAQKKSKNEVSLFLIKRGFWLVIVELVIITFSWSFNPLYNLFFLQVIWAIGISMILLGILIRLPFWLILSLGIIIVFGHNLLDYPGINKNLKGSLLADLIYFTNFSVYNIDKSHSAIIVYAFLPWTGLMLLGYCFGKLYRKSVDPLWRRKMLLMMGAGLILLFIVLRFINGYGDPVHWSHRERGGIFTFLPFLNVNKYPPSLDFLCMSIGVGMIALSLLENVQNRLTRFFQVYGRVPMFYYILHLYLIHTIAVIVFFLQGFSTSEIVTPQNPFYFKPPGFGFGLLGVYAVWIFVVLVLYPLCKRYDRYKTAHAKDRWWLSYL
jgi:uncharacterized membrane protein